MKEKNLVYLGFSGYIALLISISIVGYAFFINHVEKMQISILMMLLFIIGFIGIFGFGLYEKMLILEELIKNNKSKEN